MRPDGAGIRVNLCDVCLWSNHSGIDIAAVSYYLIALTGFLDIVNVVRFFFQPQTLSLCTHDVLRMQDDRQRFARRLPTTTGVVVGRKNDSFV